MRHTVDGCSSVCCLLPRRPLLSKAHPSPSPCVLQPPDACVCTRVLVSYYRPLAWSSTWFATAPATAPATADSFFGCFSVDSSCACRRCSWLGRPLFMCANGRQAGARSTRLPKHSHDGCCAVCKVSGEQGVWPSCCCACAAAGTSRRHPARRHPALSFRPGRRRLQRDLMAHHGFSTGSSFLSTWYCIGHRCFWIDTNQHLLASGRHGGASSAVLSRDT